MWQASSADPGRTVPVQYRYSTIYSTIYSESTVTGTGPVHLVRGLHDGGGPLLRRSLLRLVPFEHR
eukprot:478635-Pyramimonas_sp.AAC.1